MDILLEVCKVMMSWLFVYIAVELDENPQMIIWNIAYISIKYFTFVGKRHNIWNGWRVVWWLIKFSLFKSFRCVPCAAWGCIIIQHFCINWYLTPNWTPVMIILNINWLCGGAWYLGQQFWTELNNYCFGARRKHYFFILMDILLEVCKLRWDDCLFILPLNWMRILSSKFGTLHTAV